MERFHRVGGPAIEFADGEKLWFFDGEECSEEESKKIIKEVKEMSPELRLTDPREWVRNLKRVEEKPTLAHFVDMDELETEELVTETASKAIEKFSW